jgi:phospholipase D1/2
MSDASRIQLELFSTFGVITRVKNTFLILESVVIDQDISYLGGIDVCYNRWEDSKTFPLFDKDSTFFPGMDYVNPMIRAKPVGDNLVDYFDRETEHRLPWQDIQVQVTGKGARDVSKNFIQRWNLAIRTTSFPPLLPKSEPIPEDLDYLTPYKNCDVQLLRSAAKWSFGLDIPERSIYESYIELIENAEHYIYIENQYFISSTSDSTVNPTNRVAVALLRRLRKAIQKKEDFKVVMILPLQNAAPLTTATFDQTKIMTYWQLLSLFRGPDSIFEILKSEFPKVDIDNYIYIGSLRKYENVPKTGKPITEMVYVHSKIMIVDDRFALIGSANINDRSLHGNRDTEIALLVDDQEEVEITMAGKKYMAKKFAHEMRMILYQYYLGRDSNKGLEDPIQVDDEFRSISYSNTEIFKKVFIKIHETLEDESDLHFLTEYQKNVEPQHVEELKKIEGFLVHYPRNFLINSSSAKISEAIDKLFI